MAIYYWSDLDEGDAFGVDAFNSLDDQLIYNYLGISAASVSFQFIFQRPRRFVTGAGHRDCLIRRK